MSTVNIDTTNLVTDVTRIHHTMADMVSALEDINATPNDEFGPVTDDKNLALYIDRLRYYAVKGVVSELNNAMGMLFDLNLLFEQADSYIFGGCRVSINAENEIEFTVDDEEASEQE